MTNFYHVYIIAGDGRQTEAMLYRKVECSDCLHFMKKLNRWNRMSVETAAGFVYVAISDGDVVGCIDDYAFPRVSPDIYLDPCASK